MKLKMNTHGCLNAFEMDNLDYLYFDLAFILIQDSH